MRRSIAIALTVFAAGCARVPLEGQPLTTAYGAYAAQLAAAGGFRSDRDPSDAPLSAEILATNFLKIATATETQRAGDGTLLFEGATESPLLRWDRPIRLRAYGLRNGGEDAIDATLRSARRAIPAPSFVYLDAGDDGEANISLFILGNDERRELAKDLSGGPGLAGNKIGEFFAETIAIWAKRPELPCVALPVWDEDEGIVSAIILIRDEVRGRLRAACIAEEIYQSLGLFNDDSTVRPSIFNDDQEFILPTLHDEYLLRILYDPRLRPGMRRAEAKPIVAEIAAELFAEYQAEKRAAEGESR